MYQQLAVCFLFFFHVLGMLNFHKNNYCEINLKVQCHICSLAIKTKYLVADHIADLVQLNMNYQSAVWMLLFGRSRLQVLGNPQFFRSMNICLWRYLICILCSPLLSCLYLLSTVIAVCLFCLSWCYSLQTL